jgi:hypothetical protein
MDAKVGRIFHSPEAIRLLMDSKEVVFADRTEMQLQLLDKMNEAHGTG